MKAMEAYKLLWNDPILHRATDWEKFGRLMAEEFEMGPLEAATQQMQQQAGLLGQAGILGSAMGVGIQQQMYEQMINYFGTQIVQTSHDQDTTDYFARLHLKTEEAIKKGFRFFRVNKECIFKGTDYYEEPLDELRVSVAKWLKGATA